MAELPSAWVPSSPAPKAGFFDKARSTAQRAAAAAKAARDEAASKVRIVYGSECLLTLAAATRSI